MLVLLQDWNNNIVAKLHGVIKGCVSPSDRQWCEMDNDGLLQLVQWVSIGWMVTETPTCLWCWDSLCKLQSGTLQHLRGLGEKLKVIKNNMEAQRRDSCAQHSILNAVFHWVLYKCQNPTWLNNDRINDAKCYLRKQRCGELCESRNPSAPCQQLTGQTWGNNKNRGDIALNQGSDRCWHNHQQK